jgi:ribosomal-protein-alanine N-acetyltransferase
VQVLAGEAKGKRLVAVDLQHARKDLTRLNSPDEYPCHPRVRLSGPGMVLHSGAVQTERLLLVRWSEEYRDDFAALCADAKAMRFISRGRPLPRDAVDDILHRTRSMWQEHGFGPWAAIEKDSERWVGRIGLNLLADWPGPDKWEVGYELAPEFWGRGLATEGARRAITFAWEQTPLDRIISVTVPDHLASRRVMEKSGMAFQEEIVWRGTTVVWYAIDRPTSHAA